MSIENKLKYKEEFGEILRFDDIELITYRNVISILNGLQDRGLDPDS